MSRQRRARSGASGEEAAENPSFTSLPQDLLVRIALQLGQADKARLACVSKQLHQLSLDEDELWRDLELDLDSDSWNYLPPVLQRQLHHSLRLWAHRRRGAIRSLSVSWPNAFPMDDESAMRSMAQLLSSLTATLGDSLHSLRHTFTCYARWSDCLLPLGGPLKELVIQDCHLPAMPEVLTTLTCLTSLTLTLCQGYMEVQGGVPFLNRVLGKLTSLQSLTLKYAVVGEAPHTLGALSQLTSLSLAHNGLDESEGLPPSYSTLNSLVRLDLTGCGLVCVPAVLQHFTRLRTLLLGQNEVGGTPYDLEAAAMLQGDLDDLAPHHPQGVPLALSSLQRLECLCLDDTMLTTVPQAFTGLTGLTRLGLASTDLRAIPRGPYLSALQILDLSCTYTYTLLAPLGALSAATRLSHLSLRGNRHAQGELPAVLRQLPLTFLDVGRSPFTSFPPGPYTATLRELHLDGCTRTSAAAAALAAGLPHLPHLARINWRDNAKLTVVAARALLSNTPALETLWIEPISQRLTPAARKAIEQAGVELEGAAEAPTHAPPPY